MRLPYAVLHDETSPMRAAAPFESLCVFDGSVADYRGCGPERVGVCRQWPDIRYGTANGCKEASPAILRFELSVLDHYEAHHHSLISRDLTR